jgi:ribosome-binding protein aMBF1 (putative translation factor)
MSIIEAIKRGEACEICGNPFERGEPYSIKYRFGIGLYCYQCYGDAQEVKRNDQYCFKPKEHPDAK